MRRRRAFDSRVKRPPARRSTRRQTPTPAPPLVGVAQSTFQLHHAANNATMAVVVAPTSNNRCKAAPLFHAPSLGTLPAVSCAASLGECIAESLRVLALNAPFLSTTCSPSQRKHLVPLQKLTVQTPSSPHTSSLRPQPHTQFSQPVLGSEFRFGRSTNVHTPLPFLAYLTTCVYLRQSSVVDVVNCHQKRLYARSCRRIFFLS